MRSIILRAVLPVLAAVLGNGARADDMNDFRIRYGEQFLRSMTLSPRATGLGGTYAAINDGANSTFQNPAALGAVSGQEVLTNNGFEVIRDGGESASFVSHTIGGAFNINSISPEFRPTDQMGNHTIGIAYQNGDSWITGWDGLGRQSNAITIGYGRSFMAGRVLVGGAMSYEDVDISDHGGYDSQFYRLDVRGGVILRLTERLNFGGILSYGGGPGEENALSGDLDTYSEHMEVRGGLSYQVSERLLAASDLSWENLKLGEDDGLKREEQHDIVRLSGGLEYALVPERVTVRSGVYADYDDWKQKRLPGYEDESEAEFGVGLGASYFRDNWSLEYDLKLNVDGDHGHFASFVLDF